MVAGMDMVPSLPDRPPNGLDAHLALSTDSMQLSAALTPTAPRRIGSVRVVTKAVGMARNTS
jgi:hypothetical protein